MLESAYVSLMHTIARPLRSIGLLPWLERAPRRSLRFWIGSQFAIYDATRLAQMDTPWWSLRAIDAVESWIRERKGHVRVFEYGTGASTAWLARRCSHVVSVEHDAVFASTLGPNFRGDTIELRLIEPEHAPTTILAGSGRRGYEDCDFSAYVDSIADGTDAYDLIVIDGRARAACLAKAVDRLAEGGLLIFDNSDRRRYQSALARVPLQIERFRGFAPALPYRTETALIHEPNR